MKFSDESASLLKEMGVSSEKYSVSLFQAYGQDAEIIDKLLLNFMSYNKNELSTTAFNEFINGYVRPDDELLQNHAFNIFNYLRMFKDGGRFALFKGRQAEWNGPVVTLQKEDVPKSDIDKLTDGVYIYRGMSLEEFDKNQFGQSWTLDVSVARRFAFDYYRDKSRGIVARCSLEKNKAIYFSNADAESEVIIRYNSINSADKIEI